MTRNEALALVIRLAALTEHRTNDEQRALIALAWTCDKEHNEHTTGNEARFAPGWEYQDLVREAMDTRELDTTDGDRVVQAPKRWAETWATWMREDDEAAARRAAEQGGTDGP